MRLATAGLTFSQSLPAFRVRQLHAVGIRLSEGPCRTWPAESAMPFGSLPCRRSSRPPPCSRSPWASAGTTAIFTLIHAVMLRSLPVADPAALYRIGDGDDCCVEGGPQDRWGMFSFPLYERLKAETPEFEEVAAFQAGGAPVSVRREGSRDGRPPAAVRVRHRQLLLDAGRRARSADACSPRRRQPGVCAARRRAEPPRLAEHVRRRPFNRGARRSSSTDIPSP